MTPHCMMWCIWRECNSRNYEDCERTVVEIKDMMFKMLYGYLVATNSARFSNFLKILDLCSSSI
jgi:hypothetical protein